MSIYNHKELLRKDPLGEIHFVLCKLRQVLIEKASTLIIKINLQMGEVKLGKELRCRGLMTVYRF